MNEQIHPMQSRSESKVDTFACTQPCNNCPYRKDAPLKLWHKSEYIKLLSEENEQFGAIYNCHKNNGSICVGWLMKQLENGCPNLTLRMTIISKQVGKEYFDKLNSPSPLYKNVRAMIHANYPSLKQLKMSEQIPEWLITFIEERFYTKGQCGDNGEPLTIAEICKDLPLAGVLSRSADYEEVLADHRRLVRELDVIINGKNAAAQASLCDIVAQLKKEGISRSGVVWVNAIKDEINNKITELNKHDIMGHIYYNAFLKMIDKYAADKNNRGDELFNILNEVRGDKISVRTAYKKITGEKYKTKKYG